jgi:hypothetical protein
MVDAAASKAAVRKGVRVRVPLRAPTHGEAETWLDEQRQAEQLTTRSQSKKVSLGAQSAVNRPFTTLRAPSLAAGLPT